MFKRILVPLGLSCRSERAIEVALELAAASGGELSLIHVVELIPGLSYESELEFYNQLEANARRHLDEVAQRIRGRAAAAGLPPVAVEILFGSPAHVIVDRATELGVDLIALTSHRIDVEKPAVGWGTMSYKIGILAQCPVLLVK